MCGDIDGAGASRRGGGGEEGGWPGRKRRIKG